MESTHKYIESNFSDYYDLKLLELSDGTLRTEDGCSFPIHKYVLAKNSKFLYSLFASPFTGNVKGKEDILIPVVKGEALSNILCYLYTGNIRVTDENICDLIVASDYLQMDDLLLHLKQQLRKNLTLTNSLTILESSLKIGQDDISGQSFRFLQMHFETIVRCQDSRIPQLPLEILKLLLSDKNLRITSEKTVWLAIIRWVEVDPRNRLSLVSDLLVHLAISDIDEDMADEILRHDIVAKNPHCQEIDQIRSRIPGGNLSALQHYFQTHTRPLMAPSEHRQPSKLNLIAHFNRKDGKASVQVYLTYDENIDLWRKLVEIDMTEYCLENPQLLLISDCVYMFQTEEKRMLRYNIIEKHWTNLESLRESYECQVVQLDGLVYILGRSWEDDEEIYDVQVHDSRSGEWFLTTPMLPITYSEAVTYSNFIYVVGSYPNNRDRMIAQAYDPSSRTWNLLPSPSIARTQFVMVLYREMMYVIGGYNGRDDTKLKDVEVFDPNRNEWSTVENLPYLYYKPKAVVLNDKLVVYDNPFNDEFHVSAYPPVQWDVHQRRWEILENSWMKSLNMYSFLTLENSECVSFLSRENKDPATQFEYSPFA